MTRASVLSHRRLFFSIIALGCIVAAIFSTSSAFAQNDTFLDGDGHDGSVTFGNGTHRPNAIAPVSGAVSAGATSLTRGAITLGSGSNTVTFANGRLVLIIQGSGWTGGATSGSQTAVNMSGSQVGDWELARISTVAGATLNFTNPLINSYANGTTQVVAVPEYNNMTVNNAGADITGRAWDGQIGGVVAIFAAGTMNFSASGTIQANGLGFRGGQSYVENAGGITGCSAATMDGDTNGGFPAGMKGEGIYPTGYKSTSPSTLDVQEGRGNYLNAGGGGNCFNAGGGGGSNGGAGGVGGNSLVNYTDGNLAHGGLGGAVMTYNVYDRAVFGGGGGAGERNNAGSGHGSPGGGFVMVRGDTLTGTGQFRSNGVNGQDGDDDGTAYDGAGGGGAGGNVVLRFINGAACTAVSANGGVGGNNTSWAGYDWTPGGGGGGGRTYVQGSSVACAQAVNAGAAGTNGGNTFGAAAGTAGSTTSDAVGMATPTAAITSPTGGSWVTTTTPTISGTSTANATIYVYVDSNFVGTTTASGGGAWSYVSAALTQGAHNVYVRPERFGISGVNTATTNFTVDSIMPAVNISAPTEGAYTTDNTPSATFTATDSNGGTTTCATDGGAFAACSSPYTTAALADGPHSISVRHTDPAGNVTTVVRNFIVDTTAPAVNITAPTAGAFLTDNTPSATFTATDANAGTTTCATDGGAFAACSTPYTTAVLADGPHSISVRHTDLAGLQTTVVRNFTIDTTAPAVNVTAPTEGSYTIDNTPSATFTATDANAGATTCATDGGAFAACSSPYTTAALSDGPHSISVRHVDLAGLSTTVVRNFIVDTTAPSVNVTAPTEGSYITDNTPSATFSATDANAGTTTCATDGGAFAACSSPYTTAALSDGAHSISVRHTDLAGLETTVVRNFVVDTTAPSVNVSAPTEGSYTTDNTPSATFTATDANAGTTTCATDGGAFAACSSPYTTAALSDGAHSISVQHVDLAGLSTTVVRNFIVDTTAPVVAISAPTEGSTVGDSTPDITFSVTETNQGTTECSVNGGAFSACSSPFTTLALGEGTNNVAVRHTDLANQVTTTTRNFIVDTTGPAAPTIDSGPSGFVPSTGAALAFTGAEGGGTYECRIDSGSWGACMSPQNYAGLSQGSHTFEVRQIDGVGNPGAIASRTWTVDTISPAVSITAPTNGSYTTDSTPDATFTATDANAGTTTCSVDSGAYVACSSPFAMGSLTDGVHNIAVRHDDLAGNSTTVNHNFTVDTTPPAVNISGPTEGSTVGDATPDITFNVTETNPGTTECSVNGGAYSVCSSPFTTPALLDGANSVSVRHTDLAGQQTTTTRNFIVDTTAPSAPVILSPTDGFVTNDTTPTISGTAEANSSLEVFADGNSIGTTTTDGGGNWTLTPVAPLAAGDHVLTAVATDAVGNDSVPSADVTITIDTSVPAVTITAPAEASYTNDTTPQIDFGVVDNGAVTIECSVDGGAFVACGPTTYTTGALLEGGHSVTVQATDAGGNIGQAVVNFTVDTTAPTAPTIDSPLTGLVTADTTPTLSGTAEADSTVSVYADGFFIGSAIADNLGAWTFTPAGPMSDDAYDFTATATDEAGNTSGDSNLVLITIDTAAPTAPAITSPADGFRTNDTTPAVSGTAEINSTVRVYANGNLVGTTTADAGGNWSLDTSALGEGDYELTATAEDAAGNVSPASSGVDITIDTTAPLAPAITSPADESRTNDTTPTVTGTAEANSTVRVYADGFLVGTTTADINGDWTLDTSVLTEGDHELTATAEDEAGNVGPASSIVDITIDTTAPTAPVITSPADETRTNDTTPTVSGTAEISSTVRVYADGILVGTTTADINGDWTLDTSVLTEGDYELTANAEDEAGNVGPASSIVDITIDTTAPTAPLITSPADETRTNDTTPTVSGTAEAGSTVRVYADGILVGTTTADINGDWTLDTSALVEGDYELTATAEDEAGNVSPASSIVDITIDTTAPIAPAITSPADGFRTNDTTPTVSGTAEIDSTVRVYANGNLVGTTTADAGGNWSLDTSALGEGDYELTATAEDAASNVSPASSGVDITIDTTAPLAPVITSPADESRTNDTTPTVVGTAEADSTVRVYADGFLVGTTTADINGDWTLDTSALVEGDYELTATAEDEAGNVGPASSIVDITIDTTAPTAPVITSPADETRTNDTTPTVSGTAEADSTVRVYADGFLVGTTTADINGDWTLDTSALVEGDYELTATAEDEAGNVGPTSSIVDITIDTTAPLAPVITSPADGFRTNDTTPTVSGTAEIDSTVRVYADGFLVGTTTADINGDWTLDTSALVEGDYELTATAEDEAGNLSPASSIVDITIDTTAPLAPAITSPADESHTNDTTPTVTGTAEAGSTVRVYADGNLVGTTTADINGDWTLDTTVLAEGDRELTATAEDEAGNVSPASTIVDITIDTTAPAAPSVTSPADGSSTNDTTPQISGMAEPNSIVEVFVDGISIGSVPADGGGNWTITPGTPLGEGDRDITAVATDEATNSSAASAIVTVTIDTSVPTLTIDSPGASELINDNTPDIEFTALDNAPITVTCSVDGGPFVACSSPFNIGPLGEGSHTVVVNVEDAAGNDVQDDVTFTVDTIAPDTTIDNAPPVITNSDDATFEFSSEFGATFACSVDGGAYSSCTSPLNLTALLDGPHTFDVRATDTAGNTDQTPASYSWTVDTIAPGAPTISGPADGSTTTDSTPDITGTAAPNSTVTIYVDGSPIGTTTADGSGDWTFTPSTPLPDGANAITATATDAANNESVPSSTVNLNVDTIAPNTSIDSQPPNPSSDDSPSFDFSASEAVDHYECNLDGGGWATCSDPLNLSGLSDSSHTLQVRAVDLAGNTDASPASYTWTVDTTAPAAPIVTGPTNGQTTNDNTPTISGTAEANSEVTVYVDGNPIGTVTANGSGNWTLISVLLAEGGHTVTATAEDAVGNTSANATTVNFTVDTTPPDGAVLEQSGTGGPGVAPTFNISSDDPGATMTCAINGGTPAACTSPHTPTGLGPGSYTLEVEFTDEAGNSSTRSINFTITALPPLTDPTPPTVTPEADPLPPACFPKGITIYELKVAGKKLQIRGFARSQYVGKEVTINFQPTKTKVVGKATVQADGSFFTTVAAPKKALQKKGTTRYRANVDGESSFWFKLDRRMGSNLATYSGGKLNVAGFLTKPLDPKSKLTVTVRTGCNDPWTKIGDAKINRGGAFKAAIPYATDSKVLFVRMYAKVRKTPKGKATLTTYSFAIPVVTGR